MRRLFLIRHAQAEGWSRGGDHGRTLTEHGLVQAREVGELLHGEGIQVILASSAERAVQTANGLGLGVPVLSLDGLYNSDPSLMLDALAQLPPTVQVAALVAHAPGVPALAHELADSSSDSEATNRINHRFPPASFAGLEFDGEWTGLESARLFASYLG